MTARILLPTWDTHQKTLDTELNTPVALHTAYLSNALPGLGKRRNTAKTPEKRHTTAATNVVYWCESYAAALLLSGAWLPPARTLQCASNAVHSSLLMKAYIHEAQQFSVFKLAMAYGHSFLRIAVWFFMLVAIWLVHRCQVTSKNDK